MAEIPGIQSLFKLIVDERTGEVSAQITLMTTYAGRTLSKSFVVGVETLPENLLSSITAVMASVKQERAMEMFTETYKAMEVARLMGETEYASE